MTFVDTLLVYINITSSLGYMFDYCFVKVSCLMRSMLTPLVHLKRVFEVGKTIKEVPI